MPSIGDLYTKMRLDSTEWETGIAKASKSIKKMEQDVEHAANAIEKSIEGIKRSIEAIAVVEILKEGFTKLVEESSQASDAFAQVEARIRSTGGAAGVTAKQVAALSEKLGDLNGIDDDVINSMEGVLLSFTSISKQELPRVTQAVIDLSVGMKMDLKAAAVQVGKAMNDPIKGVQSLQKEGVKLTEAQKDLVAGLVKTGQTAKAQAIILKELETEFGGAAAAARNTMGGALGALKVAFDDLFKTAQDTKGMAAFREGIETSIVALRNFQKALGNANDDSDVFWQNMQIFGATFTVVFADMGLAAKHAANTVAAAFESMMPKHPEEFLGPLGQFIQGVHNQIQADAKDGSKDYVGQFLQPLIDGWKKAGETARKNMHDMDAASKKFKPGAGDTSGPKASEITEAEKAVKKQNEEWKKQSEIAVDTLNTYKQKTDALKNELNGVKEITDYEQARLKIMKQTALTDEQRKVALEALAGLEKERLKTNQAMAVKDDEKRLDKILADEKEKLKQAQNELAGKKELNVVEQAQKQIDDAIRAGKEMTAAKQKEILDTARELLKVEELQKQADAYADMDKITAALKEQADEAQLKLQGQESLIPLLRAEKQLREDAKKAGIDENDSVFQDRLKKLRETSAELEKNNALIQSQKDRIDAIVSSTDSWKKKQKELNDLLASTDPKLKITQQQYSDAMKKIASDANKTNDSAKAFVSNMKKGLEDAIFNGKKLTDVFKDMGKQLAQLAAQQLLFKPLEQWLGGGMQGGLGGLGKSLFSPVGNIFGGLGKLLKFADGGRHPANQPFLVGEKGPEIIIPDGGSGTVIPNHDLHKYNYGAGLPGYALGGRYGFSLGNSLSGSAGTAGGGSSGMRAPTTDDFLAIWQAYYHAQYDDFYKRQSEGDKTISQFMVASAEARMKQWDSYTSASAQGFQFFANGLPALMAQYPNAFGGIDPAVLNWFKSSGVPNLLPGFPAQPMSPLGGDGGSGDGGVVPTDGSYGPVNPYSGFSTSGGNYPGGSGYLGSANYGTGTAWDGTSPGYNYGARGGAQRFIGAPTEADGSHWTGVSDYNGLPGRNGYKEMADKVAQGITGGLSKGVSEAIASGTGGTLAPFSGGFQTGEGGGNMDGSPLQPSDFIDQIPSNFKDSGLTDRGDASLNQHFYDLWKDFCTEATGEQQRDARERWEQSGARHNISFSDWVTAQIEAAIKTPLYKAWETSFSKGMSLSFEEWLATPLATLGVNIPKISTGKIPGFASGGRPPVGDLALVGENGPELFISDLADRKSVV